MVSHAVWKTWPEVLSRQKLRPMPIFFRILFTWIWVYCFKMGNFWLTPWLLVKLPLLLWTGCQGTQMNNCHGNLNTGFTGLNGILLNKMSFALEIFEKCTVGMLGGPCSQHVTGNTSWLNQPQSAIIHALYMYVYCMIHGQIKHPAPFEINQSEYQKYTVQQVASRFSYAKICVNF